MPKILDASRAMRKKPVRFNQIIVLSEAANDSHFSPGFREYAEKEVERLLEKSRRGRNKKRRAQKRSVHRKP